MTSLRAPTTDKTRIVIPRPFPKAGKEGLLLTNAVFQSTQPVKKQRVHRLHPIICQKTIKEEVIHHDLGASRVKARTGGSCAACVNVPARLKQKSSHRSTDPTVTAVRVSRTNNKFAPNGIGEGS